MIKMGARAFIKNVLIFSGIRPSYLISVVNECFRFGQWIKHHHCDVKFQRREDMYQYLNGVVLKKVPIDYLEFGVFHGASLRQWSSINDSPASRFFGFDSFKGFAETWEGVWTSTPKGSFDTGGKLPVFHDERVTLVPGYFHETVQKFIEKYTPQRNLVVHLDADIYSATLFVLMSLARIFSPGTILIFDEFNLVCHEFRAFQDFTQSFCLSYKTLAITSRYEQVAFEIL